MGKYDDLIGGGKIILDVEEVLNEESAKKVDDKIKKQKAELSEPIEIKVESGRAEKRLSELTKAAKQVKNDLQEAVSSQKSFEEISKLVNKYGLLKKQIKAVIPEIDKSNGSLKESNQILKDTKKIIDRLDVSQGKLNKTRKTKKATPIVVDTTDIDEAQIQIASGSEEIADALGEQSKASKTAAKSLDELKDRYFSIIETIEKYLGLMKEFDKLSGTTQRALRKNVIGFVSDMPQDVIEMFGVQYGEKFVNGFKNAFKGISTVDLIDMVKKPSFTNTLGALEHKLDLAKTIDFGNIKYRADGAIKLSDTDNPFDHLISTHGINMMEELYEILDSISKLTANPRAQIVGASETLDIIEETIDAREKEADAIEKTTKAKIKYYEIDEKAAKLSKQNRSFDDYKEGSATASYKVSVDKMAEIAEEKKKHFPDKSEQLDQLLDRFAKNLATFINRDNQIGAQYPSVMISGAGNYNINKHNKQMASWGKNYQYYEDSVLAIENKIRGFGGSGAEVIRGDEEDALEKLEEKLEYMKYWHQVMVEVNKYYRKNKTIEGFEGAEPDEIERIKKALATMQQLGMHDVPYPSYALTNDNQNIKRIEGRITELKRLKGNDGLQEENDIYKLWTDKQDMRIRISFEMGKPDQEIIDMLKGKGFKWSRTNSAWQRQLTDNAIYATKQLQKSLHEFYKIEEQAQSATTAIETQTEATERLAGARLKLTPKNDDSGAYTALDGKYEVSQDAEGWKVYQRDNAEMWNLIGTYKHLDDVRSDASLLTREEIKYTDEVLAEIKALQEAYTSMDHDVRQHITVGEKYIELLRQVKSSALSAADAIEQLNEFAVIKGLMAPDEKTVKGNQKLTSSYKGLAEAIEEFVVAHAKVRKKNLDMDDEYWALSRVEREQRDKVLDFIPEGTQAHYDAAASLSYLLNRRERKEAVSADNILKQVEAYIKKAYVEVEQSKINETRELIGRLHTEYGDKYDSIFGEIHDKLRSLDTENAKYYYEFLIAREKEYGQMLVNRANAIAEFTKSNGDLINQFADTDNWNVVSTKVGEISAGIYETGLSLEEANKQLKEFVDNLHETVEAEHQLAQAVQETADVKKDSALAQYESNFSDAEIIQLVRGVDVGSLTKGYNISKEDRVEIQGAIKNLVSIVGELYNAENSGQDTNKLTSLISESVDQIVEMIKSTGTIKERIEKIYDDFYQYMQGKTIGYTDMDRAEFGDDWSSIIRTFGTGKHKVLTKDTGAIKVDQLWDELVDLFPQFFSKYTTNSQDQLKRVLEVLQKARDEHSGKSSMDSEIPDEAISYIYSQLATITNEVYVNAERMNAKIAKTTEQEEAFAGAIESTNESLENQGAIVRETTDLFEGLSDVVDDVTDEDNEKLKIIPQDVEESLKRIRKSLGDKKGLLDLNNVFTEGDLQEQIENLVKKTGEADFKFDSASLSGEYAQIKLVNEALGLHVTELYELKKATDDASEAILQFVETLNVTVKSKEQEKYITKQLKEVTDAKKWLLGATKRLDTQKRAYQEGQKKIDGTTTLLNVDATTLEKDVDKTIDDLVAHIQSRISENMGKSISEGLKNQITQDLNALENEIKVQQLQQYTSTTMSASEAETARQVIIDTIDTIAANAKKKNVFDQLRESYETLRARLTDSDREDYINTNFTEAINEMRVLRADMSKASAEEGSLKNILALQEQLYNAKKKVAELDVKGQLDTYEGMKASRKAAELKAQYDASVKLLENEKQRTTVTERQAQLEAELNKFKSEQAANQKRIEDNDQAISVKEQYQTILDLVNKINTANERMIKFQQMDGGSGLLGKQITDEQQKKLEAIQKLNLAMAELNIGEVLGKDQYALPDDIQSIGTDYSQIAAFINDAGVQASLTTAEIEKLVNALVKAGDIDLSILSEAFNAGNIKERAKKVSYENQYFADKTKISVDADGNTTLKVEEIEKLGVAGDTAKEKLEGLAQTIAKNSEGAVALTKNFSMGADGIARLDFSVLNTNTGEIKDFTAALGTATGQMGVFETTIDKSAKKMQAARNQMAATQDTIGRLGFGDIGLGDSNVPTRIGKVLEKIQQLNAEMAKGDTADQNKVSQYTKDLKLMTKELEKADNQMRKMESAIESGQAMGVGNIDPNGDIYGQLAKKTQELAAAEGNVTLELGRFDSATNTLNASLIHTNGTVEQIKVSMYGLNGECAAQQAGITKLTNSWDRFKASMGKAAKQLLTAFVGYNVFYKAIAEVRKGIGYVKEIDLALTELKKVTDETEESYRRFLDTAASTAGKIGSTVSDFTEATANFARLGYTMEESAQMAETAIVYKNVADGLDTVEESTDSIISTMKAFGIESNDTMGIIDRFNEVGNNFAITSAGIGEALQRSASALYAGGNTIDESIALVTAANSVIQNPEQVGTALKTLTLRLRGAKVELQEAGEDVEGMAESTSQLQAKLKALTHGKVDIMLNADTFKSTTQILREMSQVWEEMTDIEQAKRCLYVQKCA